MVSNTAMAGILDEMFPQAVTVDAKKSKGKVYLEGEVVVKYKKDKVDLQDENKSQVYSNRKSKITSQTNSEKVIKSLEAKNLKEKDTLGGINFDSVIVSDLMSV